MTPVRARPPFQPLTSGDNVVGGQAFSVLKNDFGYCLFGCDRFDPQFIRLSTPNSLSFSVSGSRRPVSKFGSSGPCLKIASNNITKVEINVVLQAELIASRAQKHLAEQGVMEGFFRISGLKVPPRSTNGRE